MIPQIVLVTGGVASGVGKGTLAAVIARRLARSGASVAYQKLEPCLQGEIAAFSNTAFGEIVVLPDGRAVDGDVARAAFYVPGFAARGDSDLSLGELLRRTLSACEDESAPRLARLADVLSERLECDEAALVVVELGGTAGEPEHTLLQRELERAAGRPAFHVHLTQVVETVGGRPTTKPAQLGLGALCTLPDAVVVRLRSVDHLDSVQTLRERLPPACQLVALVGASSWPEAAFDARLTDIPLERRFGLPPRSTADALFQGSASGRCVEVGWLDDGAGPAGYGSLVRRLTAWSGGCVRIRRLGARHDGRLRGVVRIGERRPPPVPVRLEHLPRLEIVPVEQGRSPRAPAVRPDWLGDASTPCGPVAAFIDTILGAPAPIIHSDGELSK